MWISRGVGHTMQWRDDVLVHVDRGWIGRCLGGRARPPHWPMVTGQLPHCARECLPDRPTDRCQLWSRRKAARLGPAGGVWSKGLQRGAGRRWPITRSTRSCYTSGYCRESASVDVTGSFWMNGARSLYPSQHCCCSYRGRLYRILVHRVPKLAASCEHIILKMLNNYFCDTFIKLVPDILDATTNSSIALILDFLTRLCALNCPHNKMKLKQNCFKTVLKLIWSVSFRCADSFMVSNLACWVATVTT